MVRPRVTKAAIETSPSAAPHVTAPRPRKLATAVQAPRRLPSPRNTRQGHRDHPKPYGRIGPVEAESRVDAFLRRRAARSVARTWTKEKYVRQGRHPRDLETARTTSSAASVAVCTSPTTPPWRNGGGALKETWATFTTLRSSVGARAVHVSFVNMVPGEFGRHGANATGRPHEVAEGEYREHHLGAQHEFPN